MNHLLVMLRWTAHAAMLCALLVMPACDRRSPSTPTPAPEIPNVRGRWEGSWEKTGCVDSGSVSGCDLVASGSFYLLISVQSGPVVQGASMDLSGIYGVRFQPLSGQIAGSGTLTLSGTGVVPNTGFPVTLDSWQSAVNGNAMSGSFEFSIRSQSPDITARFSGVLTNVSRTG